VVDAIGVGMNEPSVPARFVAETDIDLVLIAGRYTLLDTSAEPVLFRVALERGVRIVAAGVFNSGVLADPSPDSHYDYRRVPPDVLARAVAMRDICARHGVPLAAAALAFAAAHPAVTSVLVGMSSVAEVEQNLRHASRTIPAQLWQDLVDGGHIPAHLAPE
jgi:D-threo-aldose 1-dehydrogenase